ncbi:MAG: DNA phosphorothioation-associated putative methyltransferase [Thauera sp.]|nr:DNA phosphorothioation-associated putative methyltransferase [Thauera sp.]
MEAPATGAVGKVVAGRIYIHRLAISRLPDTLRTLATTALAVCPDADATANVLKIDEIAGVVSALHYPDFFTAAFPELREAWHIRVSEGIVSYRSYESSLNPPILHRKERLLPPDHPDFTRFSQLTEQAEALGLFEDPHLIGFRRAWDARISHAGYQLDDHQMVPLGNAVDMDEEAILDGDAIERHRTALSRSGLSAPIQALARHGLLDPERSFFDYGCGRGDDLRTLRGNHYSASGWDPYYAADGIRTSADIVNLGFVINVIEDFDERIAALHGAFDLARTVLVVSVMLYGSTPPAGRPFRDGYRTQRNTFQKYFTQTEFKEFVETVLDTEAIPVAPGILFVFADKSAEQRFLFECQRRRRGPHLRAGSYARRTSRPPRQDRVRSSRLHELVAEHRELLDALWSTCIDLGREPQCDEFPRAAEAISAFGSWKRALRIAAAVCDRQALAQAANERRDDLLVFLALRLFGKHKPYRQLDTALQRDIKTHFGDYTTALLAARQALQDAAHPALLDAASQTASEQGLGYHVPSDYLQLACSLISRLPPLLRIYVGCGAMLYGDLDRVDVVKVHIRSGKLSLLKFDDFDGKPIPLMTERIKVKLRTQEIDFFYYGEHSVLPPPLYDKSRYINEEWPRFAEQSAFDESLSALELFDPGTYGPPIAELDAALSLLRLVIQDFALRPAQDIPELDFACGPHFTYRDFIECGETWQRTRVDNRPRNPDSYNALHALATRLITPIIDYFGMVRLTYGFAGPALTREISARIAPALDQHAACELNRLGNPICTRLGAAVDLIVDDEDMLEVARWIAENLPFDRMYVYGPERPIHLSYGPEHCQQITAILPSRAGAIRYPRTMTPKTFRDFIWPP